MFEPAAFIRHVERALSGAEISQTGVYNGLSLEDSLKTHQVDDLLRLGLNHLINGPDHFETAVDVVEARFSAMEAELAMRRVAVVTALRLICRGYSPDSVERILRRALVSD